MKLRWIDTKSQRLQEVCIDLGSILKPEGDRTPLPSVSQPLPEVRIHPVDLAAAPVTDDSTSALLAKSCPGYWETRR